MDFSKKSGFLADGKICPMDFEKQYCQNPPWGGFQQYCFSKSIGICCGILKNSTVKIRPEADFKIRPAVLLCQNPSPGTSGYLEKIPRTGDGFSTRVLSLPPSLPPSLTVMVVVCTTRTLPSFESVIFWSFTSGRSVGRIGVDCRTNVPPPPHPTREESRHR